MVRPLVTLPKQFLATSSADLRRVKVGMLVPVNLCNQFGEVC
jgi:hypothetical protein